MEYLNCYSIRDERKLVIIVTKALKKFSCISLATVLLASVSVPFSASAKVKDTTYIGALSGKYNAESQSGGWSWNANTLTLSLNNCKIKTKESYGCVVPDGTKVVISGNNTISSDRVALWCSGTMTIEGSGTLNLKSKQDTALTTDEGLIIHGGSIYASTKSKLIAPVVIDKTLTINGGSLYALGHKSDSGIEVERNIRVYNGMLMAESDVDNAIEIFAGRAIYVSGGCIKGKAKGKTAYGIWSDGSIYVSGGKLRGYSGNKDKDGFGIGCVAKKEFKITGGNVKAKGNLTALAAWNRVISKDNKSGSKVNPKLSISKNMEISSGAKIRKASVSQRYYGLGAKTNDYICEKFYVLGKKGFSYDYDNFKFTNTLNKVTIK